MRVLLSPAKTFRKEAPAPAAGASQPQFLEEATRTMEVLRTLEPKTLSGLMDISPALAEETAGRHLEWAPPFHPGNSMLAVLAFHGEVYRAMGADRWNATDLDFAQDSLRILSGLYGLLKPLDLIQPYRLEMGLRWSPTGEGNLYGHWGDTLANGLAEDAAGAPIVNLASQEYAKAVKLAGQPGPVVHCHFKEERDTGFKMIGTYAKHARGLMAKFIVQERLENIDGLKAFSEEGYKFNPHLSNDTDWTFTRPSTPTS